MNLLDEQMRQDQRRLLAQWGIRFRQIGREIAPSGIQDADIIPFLHTLKYPTLFTHDQGFFKARWVHPRYCLVRLDVSDIEAATYIRRFLRHPRFDSRAKRMGVVARVHHDGIQFYARGQASVQRLEWGD
jgi:hypothetical protein